MARYHGGDPHVMVDLSSNVNPLGLPRILWEHYSRCGGRESIITRYPDYSYRDLRSAIAEFYDADPERIIPTNGADEALLITMLLHAHRRGLLVITPNYGDWHLHSKAYGFPLETHGLEIQGDTWHLDPEKLLQRIQAIQPSILLASSPNNPTGANLVPSLRQALRQDGETDDNAGPLLLLDQSYVELCPTCETSLEHYCRLFPNAVLVRSLGKWLAAAGLRIGFAYACGKGRARQLENARPAWNVNSLADCTVTHLLTENKAELREFIRATRKYVEETLPQLISLLEKHGFTVFRTTANYLLTYHPHAGSIARKLEERGIRVRDASSFTGLGPGYIRIALPDAVSMTYLFKSL